MAEESDAYRSIVAFVMPANKDPYTVEWSIPPRSSHLHFRRLVELIEETIGGRLSHYSVLARLQPGEEFRDVDLFVNDEPGELPLNMAATIIYRESMRARYPDHHPHEQELFVYGGAVLFGQKVWQ